MNKVYYLSSCSTCTKIMKNLDLSNFEKQDIKKDKITEEQLNEMFKLAGSFENLFSKRSMKYRVWRLNETLLSEEEMQHYILKEYTFLKRPVFIIGDKIYIGNSKKIVEELKQTLLTK